MPPCGTTYKMVFSKDPEQKYLYVANGTNNHIWILDRNSGKTLGSFGTNGKYADQLHWINAVGVDSKETSTRARWNRPSGSRSSCP